MERDIAGTTDQAELSSTIEHVVAAFRQWAVVLSDIPNSVLESRDSFRALFDESMRYEVNKAIDPGWWRVVSTRPGRGQGLPQD